MKNPLAEPKLKKIIISAGLGEAVKDKKVIENMSEQLTIITGQKPAVCLAKKSEAAFKLRAGQPIGLKVTLRRKRMEEFLKKLVTIVFPRVRDFQGVSEKSFDSCGNYSLGLTEQVVFPDLAFEKVDKIRGLEITIVTTAKSDEEGKKLLKEYGMPFKK